MAKALASSDDGELFLEYRESEQISLDDGRIRSAGFDTTLGFGLRAVAGEATGYAHAAELSEPALQRAAASVAAIASGHSGVMAEPPRQTNARLYSDANPLGDAGFSMRTAGVGGDRRLRARPRIPRVVQVMASLGGEWQAVQIMRGDGTRVADLRPLVRLNVSVVVERDGRRENRHFHGTGGRYGYDALTGRGRVACARWTRRCVRRWSISTRGQRRRARWRSCMAPAGPGSAARGDRARAWKAISQPQEDLGLAGLLGRSGLRCPA